MAALASYTSGFRFFGTVGLAAVVRFDFWLDGRNFRSGDNYTNRVFTAIINQAMAGQYFASSTPIGKTFRFALRFGEKPNFHDAQIIGVAASSCDEALTKKAGLEFYLSYWQLPHPGKSLVIRTTGDPRSVISGVLHILRAVDPTVAIGDVRTLEQIRNDSIAPQLFTMRLLSGFSLVAGALALIGIYGVLFLSVASRPKEMAIRMSLGSPHRNILGLILGDGLRLIAVGVVIGAVVAFASTRALSALLFGVEPTDPFTFGTMILLFVAVAVLACYIPSRRATKVDPMEALRYE